MKKLYSSVIFILAVFLIAFAVYSNTSKVYPPKGVTPPPEIAANPPSDQSTSDAANKSSTYSTTVPLEKSQERVIKKPFGIYIAPATSPVQPERFQGYHTGTDFEIFPGELNMDVTVKAICNGNISTKKYASGYGGVAVENCEIDNQSVTVIYGHLRLASISKNTGDSISAGDTLGILGADKSIETDGERKHLHLGIHKGADVNIKGYVQNKTELSSWLDPCSYVCHD